MDLIQRTFIRVAAVASISSGVASMPNNMPMATVIMIGLGAVMMYIAELK